MKFKALKSIFLKNIEHILNGNATSVTMKFVKYENYLADELTFRKKIMYKR